MSIQVSIINGRYRGKPVTGVFKLVKPWQSGANGGFVTIWNPNPEHGVPNAQRVTCSEADFTLFDEAGEELGEHVVIDTGTRAGTIETSTNYEQVFMQTETDDEAMERIAETFAMLDVIVDSSAKGTIRGLVVSGPPGIGKSFGVRKQLEVANMFRKMKGQDPDYEIISGGTSAIGLYQKLYYNRTPGRVIVFDDCDGILFEEESLNLLKAALNSDDKRRICWNKESRVLNTDDIPNYFDFEASILFLSNIDFDRTVAKGSRIAEHLKAIMSRCHYLDLEIGSTRDQLLRIRQVVRDGMLAPYLFSPQEEQDILDFVMENAEFLREISLRMVKKIADFVKTDPTQWRKLTEATCLTREAKFKRLLSKRKEAERRGVVLTETV